MFQDILRQPRFIWALCLIFNIITLLLIIFKIHPQGKIIALHYNVISGVDWYGKDYNLYQLPAAGFVISLLNFFLYRIIKQTSIFYAPLAAGASLIVQLILLFTAFLIISVN